MRPIKFRAYSLLTNKVCFNGNGLTLREIRRLGDSYFDGEIEWVEYTGLKDKNGKEGYHKDIIKRSDNLYVLEWHDNLAGWYLKPIHGGWHGITKGDFALMCEVIGNIYEELLEIK